MDLSVIIGAALTCAAGGAFPWISSEAVILGAALVLPVGQLPVLVLACATGQVVGKTVLYGLTRWAPEKLPRRAQALLAKTEPWRKKKKLLGAGLFSGALVSVPPFAVITLACGTLRLPFPIFIVAAFAGTVGRYGAILWLAVRAGIGT
jgi:membrane protein YqaA with SNARE-associated domain